MTSRSEPLGLKRGEVVLVPWDPRWPSLFDEAAAELKDVLDGELLDVHHVGSTAVPGLCAKPILDVLVSVPSFGGATSLIPKLAALGYEFQPKEEIPDRHWFRRPAGGDLRTHHLSLAEPSSLHHRVTLAFRDALRRDRSTADAYARLKLELAQRFPFDRPAYIDGKSAFVQQVLASVGVA